MSYRAKSRYLRQSVINGEVECFARCHGIVDVRLDAGDAVVGPEHGLDHRLGAFGSNSTASLQLPEFQTIRTTVQSASCRVEVAGKDRLSFLESTGEADSVFLESKVMPKMTESGVGISEASSKKVTVFPSTLFPESRSISIARYWKELDSCCK